jgi:hypothetical protein
MSTLYCPCRFRLPLQYNDERRVEPEVLVDIFQALTRQFGGYTPLGTESSDWGPQGGTEPTMGIEVAVAPHRVEELEEVVFAIGKRLGQKFMYFDAPAPSVKFIEIGESEEAAG